MSAVRLLWKRNVLQLFKGSVVNVPIRLEQMAYLHPSFGF